MNTATASPKLARASVQERARLKSILFYGYFGQYLPHHCYFFKNVAFLKRLAELGYEMTVCDDPAVDVSVARQFDWIIFDEASSTGMRFGAMSKARGIARKFLGKPGLPEKMRLFSEMRKAGLGHKAALLMHECIANVPENYDPVVHQLFDTIFTNNDAYVNNKKFFLWRLQVSDGWPEVKPVPFEHKKLLVCTLTNNYSSSRFHLGKFRRDEIRYFETRWPQGFDLFGNNWNTAVTHMQKLFPFLVPRFRSHRGYLNEGMKAIVLSKYRFNLCYENCSIQPGWISNRLFDSFRSKCVPVYLGGTNVADLVDPEAFIDRRKFKTRTELGDYLESMTENEYSNYQDAMKGFLESDRFKPFLITSLAETIASVLDKKAKFE